MKNHHYYQQEDFNGWEKTCILMTEKDAVKCCHLSLPNAWFVRVDAEMSDTLNSKIDTVLLSLLQQSNK